MLPKIIDLTESLHTPRNYFTFHLLTPGISLSKLSLLTGEFMGATGGEGKRPMVKFFKRENIFLKIQCLCAVGVDITDLLS